MGLFLTPGGAKKRTEMPYQWSPPAGSAPATQLSLWPHRSLPRRGFAVFIAITCAMLCVPLLPLLGTTALWGLLPFLALAVTGVWIALQRSYHSGRLREGRYFHYCKKRTCIV